MQESRRVDLQHYQQRDGWLAADRRVRGLRLVPVPRPCKCCGGHSHRCDHLAIQGAAGTPNAAFHVHHRGRGHAWVYRRRRSCDLQFAVAEPLRLHGLFFTLIPTQGLSSLSIGPKFSRDSLLLRLLATLFKPFPLCGPRLHDQATILRCPQPHADLYSDKHFRVRGDSLADDRAQVPSLAPIHHTLPDHLILGHSSAVGNLCMH